MAEDMDMLVNALQDADETVRFQALDTLINHWGNAAVDLIVEALNDPSKMMRRRAVSGLEELNVIESVGFLMQMLRDDDWQVRAYTAMALGTLGDPQAIPALVESLEDFEEPSYANTTVSALAAQSLEQIGTPEAMDALNAWWEHLHGGS